MTMILPTMDYITSREFRAFLDKGGDLALVPLGTVERLGPHLPLGARNIVVSAIARLIANSNNGLCLPVIPYGTVYDAFNQRGSIDITPGFMHGYSYNVCDELVANGFKRIIFVSFQEELYYLSHEYFQEHNLAVIYLNPNSFYEMPDSTVSSLDAHGRELWRLVGCLQSLGNEETLNRVFEKSREYFHTFAPVVNRAKRNLDLLGVTGHKMGENEWQFYPVNLGKGLEDPSIPFAMPEQALVDQARDELLGWIRSLSQSIADLTTYQNYLNRTTFSRPQ